MAPRAAVAQKPQPDNAFKIPAHNANPNYHPPLGENAIADSAFCRTERVAVIPPGVPLSRVLEDSYWANLASSIRQAVRPGDHIECRWADFSGYALLMVVRPTKVSVSVKKILHVDWRAESTDIDLGAELSNYLIRWAGETVGYRVIYKPDNSVLCDQLSTEAAARRWLMAHLADAAGKPETPKAQALGAKPEPVMSDEKA